MQLSRDIEDVRLLADTIRICRNGGCRDEEGVERLYWEGEEPSQGAGVPYDKRGPHGFDIDGLA